MRKSLKLRWTRFDPGKSLKEKMGLRRGGPPFASMTWIRFNGSLEILEPLSLAIKAPRLKRA